MAAAVIGYFGFHAFTGNRGLNAKHDIDQQMAELTAELGRLKAEREQWARRVALLRSDRIDPDMLDERARVLLNYAHPNDVTMMLSEAALTVRRVDAILLSARYFRQAGVARQVACVFRSLLAAFHGLERIAWFIVAPSYDPKFADCEVSARLASFYLSEGTQHASQPLQEDARQAATREASAGRQKPEFGKEQELEAYREMLLIRRFEEKAGQMYGMGLIGGFCHLYIGQEAVVVGMQMALEDGRPGHHRLSRSRPHAGLRHGPQGRDGRTDRTPRRLFQGQGRLDAHVLRREGLLRRPRHCRRAGLARHRPRLRQPLSRQRAMSA